MSSKLLSNLKELRKILNEYQLESTDVAVEFLDAIEEDVDNVIDELSKAKSEIRDYENDDLVEEEKEEVDLVNSDFVGLDTINWSLDNGNLVIQQKMEYFIEALQKQNAVVPV